MASTTLYLALSPDYPDPADPDAAAVRELVAATHRTGVGAVFGIAEQASDGGHYITQLYGYAGRLLGRYRKRHLGPDESAYRTGAGHGVFPLGAARFGITICAESGVDFPWIGHRSDTFPLGSRWMTQQERWILCRTAPFSPDPELLPALRAENVHELRWWSAAELRAAGVTTAPRDLADLLDRVHAGRLPAAGTDLGV